MSFTLPAMNAGNARRRAIADANWFRPVKIGKHTRTIIDWMGRISDPQISAHCMYQPSTVGMKRRMLDIPRFTGCSMTSSFEIAHIRESRLKDGLNLWAKKRPKGMAEFIREDSWIKMLKYYG